ncbi:MAG: hypothetical protein ACHQK8_00270 [Bacteroidia bacterium]
MKINRNNYEMYMIDYLDGKLSAAEVTELLHFIQQYPDLIKEFELLNIPVPSLDTGSETIDKSFLKKPDYGSLENSYEEKLITYLEGEMSKVEMDELEKHFIIYPELKAESELFRKTKLAPDKNIVFKNKNALKKSVPLFSNYQNYLWRAAAVLFLCGLILFLNRTPPEYTTAVKNPVQPKTYTNPESQLQTTRSNSEKAIVSLVPGKKYDSQATSHTVIKSPVETEILKKKDPIRFESIEEMGLRQIAINNENDLQNTLTVIAHSISDPGTGRLKEQDRFLDLPQFIEQRISYTTSKVLVEQNKPDSVLAHSALSNIGLLLVRLYNKVTGDDARVVKKYNNSGKVIGFGILANNFQFSTGK